MKRSKLGIALVAGTMFVTGTAFAGWVNKSDPNDENTPIDIKRMSLNVPRGTPFGSGKAIQCKVTYWGNVEKEQVRNFRCFFDIKGSSSSEGYAQVEWDTAAGRLVAKWWRYRNGVPEETGTNLRASHNAETDSTTVKVPRKKLRGRDSHLRWSGYTWSNEPPCPDAGFGCDDRAPNSGDGWRYGYH